MLIISLLLGIASARATPPDWLSRHLACHMAEQTSMSNLSPRVVNALDSALTEDEKALANLWDKVMVFPGTRGDQVGIWILGVNNVYFAQFPPVQLSRVVLTVSAPSIARPIAISLERSNAEPGHLTINVYPPIPNDPEANAVNAEIARPEDEAEAQSANALWLPMRAAIIAGGLTKRNYHAFDKCLQSMRGDKVANDFVQDLDILTTIDPLK